MTGVRAEFVFEQPDACPVATVSTEMDGQLREISWTERGDGPVTEQFTASDAPTESDVREVFDYGTRQVYEFERDYGDLCVCEYIETALGPVADSYVANGDLHVTIHAGDVDKLRELLGALHDRFDGVHIAYLVQGREHASESAIVPVDLRRLTDRQREVLRTAHEMGYFEYPRAANASEVARELGIEPPTFTEHLNAAQSKLLAELLARE